MSEAATASQILDVAQALCQQRGFNGFSYRDIAEKLGIKSASIHYHYPAKADLGEALVIRYRGDFAAALARIRAAGGDARKQLHLFTKALGALAHDEKKLCLCAMLVADSDTLSPAMRKEVMGFFEDTERWIEECLTTGRRKGVLSFDGSPKIIAQSFVAALQGMLISARAFDDAGRFERTSEWLNSVLI